MGPSLVRDIFLSTHLHVSLFIKQILIRCPLYTRFYIKQRNELYSWTYSSGCSKTLIWTPICLFLQLLFSATAYSFLSSARPHLTPPYLSFYPGPILTYLVCLTLSVLFIVVYVTGHHSIHHTSNMDSAYYCVFKLTNFVT